MSDYVTMQNLIAKRVRHSASASASGMQADIKDAITEAISFYKHQLFWFNQQDATANTVADQEYYPLPGDYIAMMNVKARYDPQRWYELHLRSESEIDEENSSDTTSRPYYYCIHNEQLRISPIPDDVYVLNMSYVRDILVDEPLSADTDTNSWMTEAGPLIRYHAQAILWDDLIRNPQEADRAYGRAKMYHDQLKERTRTYLSSGWISPQVF